MKNENLKLVEVFLSNEDKELLNNCFKNGNKKFKIPKYMRLLLFLFDNIDFNNVCVLSQQEMANKIGYSRPTVNNYIRLLRKLGYLEDERIIYKNKLTISGYIISVEYKYLSVLDEVMEYDFKLKYYNLLKEKGYRWIDFEQKFNELIDITSQNKDSLYCTFCGEKIENDWCFCKYCGKQIK